MGVVLSLLVSAGIILAIYLIVKRRYGNSVRFLVLDEGREALGKKISESKDKRKSKRVEEKPSRPITPSGPSRLESNDALSDDERAEEVVGLQELWSMEFKDEKEEKA